MPDTARFGESPLRLDGLYRRGGALSNGSPITYFLRFAEDGSVQSAWMRGEDCSGRDGDYELNRHPAADRVEGTFKVDGAALSFATKASNGIIEYQGVIEADGSLVLDSHSHINGNQEADNRFEFVEIEEGPRRLTEMIPRCIKLDCRKLRSGSVFEHGCGLRTTDGGWPLPGEDEAVLGRWNVMGARLFIDMKDDPDFGVYITDGSLGVLVTDKSIRGSFYEGKGQPGKLSLLRDVFTFYWPYSLMAEPGYSHYRDDRRMHVMIEDPEQDGHLGLQGITIPKGRKPDDFLSPVLSVKNRAPEFLEQVGRARERFLAGKPASPVSTGPTEGAPPNEPAAAEPRGARVGEQPEAGEPTGEAECGSCGGEVAADDRYCSSCGEELAGP